LLFFSIKKAVYPYFCSILVQIHQFSAMKPLPLSDLELPHLSSDQWLPLSVRPLVSSNYQYPEYLCLPDHSLSHLLVTSLICHIPVTVVTSFICKTSGYPGLPLSTVRPLVISNSDIWFLLLPQTLVTSFVCHTLWLPLASVIHSGYILHLSYPLVTSRICHTLWLPLTSIISSGYLLYLICQIPVYLSHLSNPRLPLSSGKP